MNETERAINALLNLQINLMGKQYNKFIREFLDWLRFQTISGFYWQFANIFVNSCNIGF